MSDEERKLIKWEYGKCALDANPADFGPFQSIVSLWQSKRKGNELPLRRDFEFSDFRGLWGRVAIVNLERDPFNVRFTLWGTKLAEWWGVDYTGKLLGEKAINPEAWKTVEGRYFVEMSERPFIGLIQGHLDQYKRSHRRVVGVDLPLSDGKQVSQVFLIHMELPEGQCFEDLFPNAPIDQFF
ncbi:PAS domain-containing protein [Sneathiella limimaris]|uniref:PAS domain-containing protein n=1 Tax=Sneathiella limimaris TaxID=1964213 RepID=UPI00146DB425|nr:PAS domain-containing protein [Sneathiella limimaris]